MFFLGLGSNLSSSFGDRFENLNLAVSYLETYYIKINKRSNFYETPSYPDIKNPKFINLVVEVSTNLSLEDLVSALIFVEKTTFNEEAGFCILKPDKEKLVL